MPKNWIAMTIGPNGGPSNTNSGLVSNQAEAEKWATTAMSKPSVEGVLIAKIHSRAQRVQSPVEFVGVSDVVDLVQPEDKAA